MVKGRNCDLRLFWTKTFTCANLSRYYSQPESLPLNQFLIWGLMAKCCYIPHTFQPFSNHSPSLFSISRTIQPIHLYYSLQRIRSNQFQPFFSSFPHRMRCLLTPFTKTHTINTILPGKLCNISTSHRVLFPNFWTKSKQLLLPCSAF